MSSSSHRSMHLTGPRRIVDVGSNARSVISRRSHSLSTTSPMSVLIFDAGRCNKTVVIPIIFFVWCTLIAQTILTTRYEVGVCWSSSDPTLPSWGYRIYAVTMKNVVITSVFVCITVPQLALGIYQVILTARYPGMASVCVDLCHPGSDR